MSKRSEMIVVKHLLTNIFSTLQDAYTYRAGDSTRELYPYYPMKFSSWYDYEKPLDLDSRSLLIKFMVFRIDLDKVLKIWIKSGFKPKPSDYDSRCDSYFDELETQTITNEMELLRCLVSLVSGRTVAYSSDCLDYSSKDSDIMRTAVIEILEYLRKIINKEIIGRIEKKW